MSRFIIFLYGVIAYLLFFGAFNYAMFFVIDVLVPKTINTGEAGSPLMAVLINVPLMGLFAVQHMIMARPWFKRWFTQYVPAAMERSTFVLAASALLILIMAFWQPIPGIVWHVEHPIARALLMGTAFAGFGIVLFSSFLIDHFDLFGLRQVTLHLLGKPYTHKPFIERSFYKLVRHPLMVGFLIGFWVTPTMTLGHLLFACVITGYIIIGVSMEERDLVRAHGEQYINYARRTPRFIPRLSRRQQQPHTQDPMHA